MANAPLPALPSYEQVYSVLDYDPKNGTFIWKHREDVHHEVNARYAGKLAGGVNGRGYTYIEIKGRAFRAHRLAWLLVYGSWPDRLIDHINGNVADNRIQNLRLANSQQNGANRRKKFSSKSGYKGVSASRWGGWVAQITINGKNRHLGTFSTPELAHEAYMAAAIGAYGDFASDGQAALVPQEAA